MGDRTLRIVRCSLILCVPKKCVHAPRVHARACLLVTVKEGGVAGAPERGYDLSVVMDEVAQRLAAPVYLEVLGGRGEGVGSVAES